VDDGWQTPAVRDYRVHARNAAAMWEALSKGYGALLVGTEEVRIVAPSPYHALRAIVVDPDTNRRTTIGAILETVMGESRLSRRVVEDASGALDLARHGLEPRLRMTVMGRPSGCFATEWSCGTLPGRSAPSGVDVAVAVNKDVLAIGEQIMMTVFPPPPSDDDLRGRIQPARVLGIEGWRVWIGYRGGVPAGAAYTYHDGSSLGVYQVATLPEHRGHGVARAIMLAILRAYPDDVMTLTATDQGRPLYVELGFEPWSDAVWWRPNHTGDDSGEGLR